MGKRYAVRYFIVWPPPHPTYRKMVWARRDGVFFYWQESKRAWYLARESATAYKDRLEAEVKLLLAAASGVGEAIGNVRTSRQLVRLIVPHNLCDDETG